MGLLESRQEIDRIDDEILRLFIERMGHSAEIADYKLKNSLPVMQAGREKEILASLAEKTPRELQSAVGLLFQSIMDISKCAQRDRITDALPPKFSAGMTGNPDVVCQGVSGSYSDAAANLLFGSDRKSLRFLPSFDAIFEAVSNGYADYGVLPIENSAAGDVFQTYALLARSELYISKRISVRIEHVLAAKKGTRFSDVKTAASHSHALKQCGIFLKAHGIAEVEAENTAIAAKRLAADECSADAVICSRRAASLYGLDIIAENIADNSENFTRFICVSKKPELTEKADIVSIALSLPHTSGSLYRLLTRFSYAGLNLLRLDSKPLPVGVEKDCDFDVIFYLDFAGRITSREVYSLLDTLKKEMKYYRLLGNYEEV